MFNFGASSFIIENSHKIINTESKRSGRWLKSGVIEIQMDHLEMQGITKSKYKMNVENKSEQIHQTSQYRPTPDLVDHIYTVLFNPLRQTHYQCTQRNP